MVNRRVAKEGRGPLAVPVIGNDPKFRVSRFSQGRSECVVGRAYSRAVLVERRFIEEREIFPIHVCWGTPSHFMGRRLASTLDPPGDVNQYFSLVPLRTWKDQKRRCSQRLVRVVGVFGFGARW